MVVFITGDHVERKDPWRMLPVICVHVSHVFERVCVKTLSCGNRIFVMSQSAPYLSQVGGQPPAVFGTTLFFPVLQAK